MNLKNCTAPLVTVVVPVFNGEAYIEQGLRDIMKQSYENIEVIAIDDGSEDNSLAIMKKLAEEESRLTVLQQDNRGAGFTRNRGLKAAKGKYIAFWDSDDSFAPNTLEKCVILAEQLAAELIVYKAMTYNFISRKKALLNDGLDALEAQGISTFAPQEVADKLFNVLLIQIWNKLYRRDLLLEAGIEFQEIARSNDILFTVKALCSARRIGLLNEPLVSYRVGAENGLHSSNDKTPLCFYEALIASKNYLITEGLDSLYGCSFERLAMDVIFYNLIVIKTQKARKIVIDKLRQDGLELLGLADYSIWAKQGCLLQYFALCYCNSFRLIKLSYLITKAKAYYKEAGIRGTLNKIKMYIGS